jgi:hypothetical protein
MVRSFSDGCVNDWGGGDYRDLMNGVDAALARFSVPRWHSHGRHRRQLRRLLTDNLGRDTDLIASALSGAVASTLESGQFLLDVALPGSDSREFDG